MSRNSKSSLSWLREEQEMIWVDGKLKETQTNRKVSLKVKQER